MEGQGWAKERMSKKVAMVKKVCSNHFDERAGASDKGQSQLGVGVVINFQQKNL